ncbi:MAG: hypothetical protein AB3N64_08840 [Puniceicoccaceae bacterium]
MRAGFLAGLSTLLPTVAFASRLDRWVARYGVGQLEQDGTLILQLELDAKHMGIALDELSRMAGRLYCDGSQARCQLEGKQVLLNLRIS